MDEQTNVQQPEALSGCLQNHYFMDKSHLEEGLRVTMRRTPLSIFLYVLYAAVILFTVDRIVFLLNLGVPVRSIAALFVCLAVLVLMLMFRLFFMAKLSARAQMRRKEELLNTDRFEVCASFTPEVLEISASVNSEHLSVGYDKLKRVFRTKRLIVLMTKQRQLFLLDRQGFVNGTEADFWKLIAEKRPDLKLPKH